jgi:hypothetical protein
MHPFLMSKAQKYKLSTIRLVPKQWFIYNLRPFLLEREADRVSILCVYKALYPN